MFRFFRKKRPTLKPEMIEPADVPISTTEAKRIYRDYLKAYDRDLDARGRAEAVQQFAYLMKEREEEYTLAIANKKEGIKDTLSDIKELKARLKKAPGDDREDIEGEIEYLEELLISPEKNVAECESILAEFKADKRAFLVEYINAENEMAG
jgi:hypothetical protein